MDNYESCFSLVMGIVVYRLDAVFTGPTFRNVTNQGQRRVAERWTDCTSNRRSRCPDVQMGGIVGVYQLQVQDFCEDGVGLSSESVG